MENKKKVFAAQSQLNSQVCMMDFINETFDVNTTSGAREMHVCLSSLMVPPSNYNWCNMESVFRNMHK